MVDRTVFLGSTTQVMVRLPQGAVLQSLITNTAERDTLSTGQPVTVCLPSDSLRVLASSTTRVDGQPKDEADEPVPTAVAEGA
jgi:hypothetical protein